MPASQQDIITYLRNRGNPLLERLSFLMNNRLSLGGSFHSEATKLLSEVKEVHGKAEEIRRLVNAPENGH